MEKTDTITEIETSIKNRDLESYSEETRKTVKALIEAGLFEAGARFLDLEDDARERREAEKLRAEKRLAVRITDKIDSAKKADRVNGLLTGKETGDLSRTVRFLAFGGNPPVAPITKNGNKNEFGANYGVKSLYEAYVAGVFDETPKAEEARKRIRRLFA